jgi:hypothetical protein
MSPVRPALLLAALLLAACGHGAPTGSAGAGSAAPPTRPTASDAPEPPATPASPQTPGATAVSNPNPLGLAPAHAAIEAGRRVFTFPEQMLASAKPGSTLVLYGATVAGIEGDDLIIEGRGSPSYKVHPGYVILVPDDPPRKIGDPVLTERAGLMHHAVVTRLLRDRLGERVGVRFTDGDTRGQDALLLGGSGKPVGGAASKAARFLTQTAGLAPGNYAVVQRGADWLHVLLVSSSGEGASRRWLALGFGGAAMIVDEAELHAVPVRFAAKPGSVVWAEAAGKMRRATVQSTDDPGLFSVKYERAGRPATVGWGLVMAPLEP